MRRIGMWMVCALMCTVAAGCAGSAQVVVDASESDSDSEVVDKTSGSQEGGEKKVIHEDEPEGLPRKPAAWRAEAVESKVKLGSTLQIEVTNITDTAIVYQDPGGTNGCYQIFEIYVLVGQEVRYSTTYTGFGMACAAVMVPPSKVIWEPGKPAMFLIDTSAQFYTDRFLRKDFAIRNGPPPRKPLPKGRHQAVIAGGGGMWTIDFEVY